MRVKLLAPHDVAGEGGTGIPGYLQDLRDALDRRDDVSVGIDHLGTGEVEILGRKVGGYVSTVAQAVLKRLDDADVYHTISLRGMHRRTDVLTVHDIAFLERPEEYPAALGRFWELYRGWMEDLPAIVTPTAYIADKVRDELDVDPDRVHPIHLGLDHDTFHVDTDQDLLDDGTRNVLTVGQWRERKNLLDVVETLAGFDDVALHHAGPTDDIQGYRSRCLEVVDDTGLAFEERGYVTRDELRGLYSEADLLFYPSTEEGFGFPPLEAAACGTPSLLSPIDVFKETIGDDARFTPTVRRGDDPEGWDEAAAAALDGDVDPSTLTEAAGRFTWDRTAEETVDVYRDVVDAR